MSPREPELLGQTVVVLGGSAGIGLEAARRARLDGAEVVVTGRDPERLERAAVEVEELSVHTPDLDDVFFALTGHPTDEATDDAESAELDSDLEVSHR